MPKNNSVVPQARAALEQFKMKSVREVGVQFPLKQKSAQNHTLYDKHIQHDVSESRFYEKTAFCL